MANTRGRTSIHGPSSTGTIKAGNVVTGVPAFPAGSGATAGSRTTVRPGTVAPGRNASPKPSGSSGINAGMKTTINTPGKKMGYSGGAGVGSNTPYKRKKQRRLGTNNGQTPA